MKCEEAQQSIVQYIYGELPDVSCYRLERHVAGCGHCREELQAYQALHQAIRSVPVEEPSPNFLAQSRIRLDAALDMLPPPGLLAKLGIGFSGLMAQLRAAPGMALAVAIVGLGIGATGGHFWKQIHGNQLSLPAAAVATQVKPAAIATSTSIKHKEFSGPAASATSTTANAVAADPSVLDVNEIVQHPKNNMVEVHFNRMVPATIEGSISDPEVQRLLLMATQNPINPDVRSNSVSLLAEQCTESQSCDDESVRTALMVALRYDINPGVRLKALEGLAPFIAQDVHVRDAVLETLMHDPSQLVRRHALQLMEPVRVDSSVRMVLRTISTGDDNPAMRKASLKLLQTIPPTE